MLVETEGLIRLPKWAKERGIPRRTVFSWYQAGRLVVYDLDGICYVSRDAEVLPRKSGK